MGAKQETVFRKRVVAELKKLENIYFFSVQQVAIRGCPDLCLCINGNFVSLELKKDKKAEIAPLQRYTLQKIIKAKGIAFIAYPENWFEIYAYLEILSKKETQ